MNSTYQGAPGDRRDPATPGSYCLARCYCRRCPQHAQQQHTTETLRQQEYAARDRLEGQRHARADRRAT